MNEKNLVWKKKSFTLEMKMIFTNKTNIFCNSKNFPGLNENENFLECKICFQDFCITCFSNCHKCTGYSGELMNYTVYEYASSCHCNHQSEKRNFSEYRIYCFYAEILKDFLISYDSDNSNSM